MTKIVAKARGYVATLTREGRDYDVQITHKGAVVVAGMYGAGMLDLSEYSPDGKRVTLSASVVEAIEEAITEAIEEAASEDESEDE